MLLLIQMDHHMVHSCLAVTRGQQGHCDGHGNHNSHHLMSVLWEHVWDRKHKCTSFKLNCLWCVHGASIFFFLNHGIITKGITVVTIHFFFSVFLKLAGSTCGFWKVIYSKYMHNDSRINRSHKKSLRKWCCLAWQRGD